MTETTAALLAGDLARKLQRAFTTFARTAVPPVNVSVGLRLTGAELAYLIDCVKARG